MRAKGLHFEAMKRLAIHLFRAECLHIVADSGEEIQALSPMPGMVVR